VHISSSDGSGCPLCPNPWDMECPTPSVVSISTHPSRPSQPAFICLPHPVAIIAECLTHCGPPSGRPCTIAALGYPLSPLIPPSVAPACGRPGVPSPPSRIPGRAEDSVSYAVGCVTYKPLPVRLPCHCEGIRPTPPRWGKSVGADEGVTAAQSRFSPAAIRTGPRGDVPQNPASPDVEDVSAPIGLKLGRHSVGEVGSGQYTAADWYCIFPSLVWIVQV